MPSEPTMRRVWILRDGEWIDCAFSDVCKGDLVQLHGNNESIALATTDARELSPPAYGDFMATELGRMTREEVAAMVKSIRGDSDKLLADACLALVPLAQQDCESWGCEDPQCNGGDDCEPAEARRVRERIISAKVF